MPTLVGDLNLTTEQTRTRPRLLLDVDGVINAVYSSPPGCWTDWHRVNLGVTIRYADEVCHFLTAVSDHAEVLWLTTWGSSAQDDLAPALGLPAWDLAGPHPEGTAWAREDDWWKLVIARELYDRDPRRFIWIDDDLAYDHDAHGWLASLPAGSYLAIAPDFAVGITPSPKSVMAERLDRTMPPVKPGGDGDLADRTPLRPEAGTPPIGLRLGHPLRQVGGDVDV